MNKSQSYGNCTHLRYEYTRVGMYSYYENITVVHCSVTVCIRVLPFLLYLKECVVISNTVLCNWQERRGLQAQTHAKHTCLKTASNVAASLVGPSPNDL